MIPTDFFTALSFAQTHGYILVFIIMVFEGPMITTAAAFAASLGFFNVWIILLLSLLGDLTGDALFYSIGSFSREALLDKYGKYMGINKTIVRTIEKKLKEHFVKTFIFIKYTPILCMPGLIITGMLKIPLKKFFGWAFIITFPRNIFFTALGFYGGLAIVSILKYFKFAQYSVPVGILIGVLIYFAIKKLTTSYWTGKKIIKTLKKSK
jgi:membrane protein DedA with SNARE-associated domain